MKYSKFFLGEFIGSCFLVMIIVGSGIMAENLTDDTGIMLLANTIATGAGLFVLITVFSDVSGAHFNPFVSLAMYLTKKLKGNLLPTYISAQILGCLLGVALANFFFEQNFSFFFPKFFHHLIANSSHPAFRMNHSLAT